MFDPCNPGFGAHSLPPPQFLGANYCMAAVIFPSHLGFFLGRQTYTKV
jgi:hypothetical protein